MRRGGAARGLLRQADRRSRRARTCPSGPSPGPGEPGAARAYPEAVLLTESIIDALSLVVMGFQNAIPCYGVHGFTEEHGALLFARNGWHSCSSVSTRMPRGAVAHGELVQKLAGMGMAAARSARRTARTANEYLVAGGGGEEVKQLLEEAKSKAAAAIAPATPAVAVKQAGQRFYELDGIRYRVSGVQGAVRREPPGEPPR